MPISSSVLKSIDQALAVRQSLLEDAATDALRILNGEADGIPGLVVEKLGPVLIAQLYEERLTLGEETAGQLAEELHRRLRTKAVYRKRFLRERGHVPPEVTAAHKNPRPWIGEATEPELAVREHGLQFLIRPYDGFACGLFLDHRENRRRIRELAAGKRVLNTFAYTCGFSVAAAAGGATHVASVDAYKRYLEWGKRNFQINGLDQAPHRFYCSDMFGFYKRARRQGLRYDLIILDPPTFSRQSKPQRVFVLGEQLERLCAETAELLNNGGLLLAATNDRGIHIRRLEQAVTTAAVGRRATIVERPPLPADFAGDPDYSKVIIARLD